MIQTSDGKAYTQSKAVLRYAAKKGGLYPKDDEAAYAVDNIIEAVDDLREQAYKIIFSRIAGNTDLDMIANFKNNVMPLHLTNLGNHLGDNDFFVGNEVSAADMTMFDVLNDFSFNLFPSAKANFPKLVAFYNRVAALPKIKAYMATDKYKNLAMWPSFE